MKTKIEPTATPKCVEQTREQVRAEIARLTERLGVLNQLESGLETAFGTATVETVPPVKKPRKYARRENANPPPAEPAEKPKRKYTRKVTASRPLSAPAPAVVPAAPAPASSSDTPPGTFAGAVKRVMREGHAQGKLLMVAEIFAAIEARWPELAAEKDGNNVMVNLAYAASQGKCEKVGRGALATFKILDAGYFKETETEA